MSSRAAKLFIALLATTVLGGCTLNQEMTNGVRSVQREATAGLATAASPMPVADKTPIKVQSGVYVGTKSIRNENGDPLPSKLEGKSGITIVKTSPQSLRDLSVLITQQTKIPVVISAAAPTGGSGAGAPNADAASASGGARPQAAAPNLGIANGPVPDGFPIEMALSQLQGSSAVAAPSAGLPPVATTVSLPLNYSGPLSGLMDLLASQYDVAWKYHNGRIVIESVVTRSFDVPALAMASSLKFDLSSKSSATGEGGSTPQAGQEASATSSTDILQEINGTLDKMLPGEGSSFTVNRSTGLVTVTATPAVINRVSDYISTINKRLSEQVALSVKVYSLVIDNKEEFDLDVNGLFNKATKYGLAMGTAGSGGVVPPVGGLGGPGLGWALLDTKSKWAGSNALVNALSEKGDISVVTTASVTTVSGVPVPLQVGEERDYVKQVEVTPGTDGAQATASITPGTVSTGFSLQINPRVERNGDVLVQYGINISELSGSEDGFESFETMGTKVQLRRISQRNFIQQARIPHGNTLVLAGFEQVRNEAKKRGLGRQALPIFGGGAKAGVKREIIVIMITPTLLK
ncbi:PilN family type IVB pilus formation outer membrane protein [Mesorhizobium sp. SP-1A]|uniref:PilN family type IVB pilus formation outer membrane protein n=1 Tax=Mesorhizobium sp. SP-1A TaxID=3077840 RepID=UPI0028F71E2A|nr:PilN family type IVB pilus formation outer membrane protein [Mesorhizobium sp. SP-1A]